MKKIPPILLATILVSCGALHAQTKSRSDALLEKLAEFELSERFKAEVTIEQKRKEVAKTLEAYRDQALEAKDLKRANEIQAKIDDLDAGKAVKPEQDPIVGIWKWFNGRYVTFVPDGSSHHVTSRSVNRYTWERKPDGTYVMTYRTGNKDTFVLKGDTLIANTERRQLAERVK